MGIVPKDFYKASCFVEGVDLSPCLWQMGFSEVTSSLLFYIFISFQSQSFCYNTTENIYSHSQGCILVVVIKASPSFLIRSELSCIANYKYLWLFSRNKGTVTSRGSTEKCSLLTCPMGSPRPRVKRKVGRQRLFNSFFPKEQAKAECWLPASVVISRHS